MPHDRSSPMENRQIALITIRNLLEDPELFADKDAIPALAEIDNMEREEFDARSVERKVQADFRQ